MELSTLLLLTLAPEMGPVRVQRVVDFFGGDSQKILAASPHELRQVEGLGERLSVQLSAFLRAGLKPAEAELKTAQKQGISLLPIHDPRYPQLLEQITDPPPILYIWGNPEVLQTPSLAIVGTRRPTPYGERVAGSFAEELAKLGFCITSGLARGIDTTAHHSALKAQGKTVAVLGCGLMQVYPSENKKLAESIVQNAGAVISEFALKTPPEAGNFPRRNRIISGLSHATIVVECLEKSGAMITARMSAEQGRETFAVPGPVTSPFSQGPHRLLKDGAKLAISGQDVLRELGGTGATAAIGVYKSENSPYNGASPETVLSEKEKIIFSQIGYEALPAEVLWSKTALPAGDFAQLLLGLELKGVIRSLPGKGYVRTA